MSDGCLIFSGGIEGLGAIYYRDRCSKEPRYERIVIDLLLEGKYPYEAVIDTASEWCILHPELAALIEEWIVGALLWARAENAAARRVTLRDSTSEECRMRVGWPA